jgi:hypothetical protein
MNLEDPRHPWRRLTSAARHAPDERDTTAPYGFATRVAALALAQEQRISSLFERFALRAVALSCLLALASVALNYRELRTLTSAPAPTVQEDDTAAADDALAAVLEFGD